MKKITLFVDSFANVGGAPAVIAQASVWLIAVICAIGGVLQMKSTAAAVTHVAAVSVKLPKVTALREPLREEDYKSLRSLLYLQPGVVSSIKPDGIEIVALSITDYPAWRAAISEVMALAPSAQWEMKSLCAGSDCPSSAKYSAILAATRLRVDVK